MIIVVVAGLTRLWYISIYLKIGIKFTQSLHSYPVLLLDTLCFELVLARLLSGPKRFAKRIIINKYLDDQLVATAMSISNDIDEVSTCIVCPHCRLKSQKDWIVKHLESRKRPKIRISLVYFRCVSCNEITKINDPKLIKFIDYEVMKNDQY